MNSLDLDRIRQAPLVGSLVHYAEIGSTNDAALALAASGDVPLPALVIAERQTAGRGRGANRWWAAGGALTFSLLVDQSRLPGERARWPQASLASALAVARTVEAFASGTQPLVKWPNDVFVDGRKISGILIEAPALAGRAPQMVIGIGLNVNNRWSEAPEEIASVGTSLADLAGNEHDMTSVLVALLAALEEELARLVEGDPQQSNQWQARCYLRGRQVEIESGQRRIRGRCEGIDRDGALVIESAGKRERFIAGTVVDYERR